MHCSDSHLVRLRLRSLKTPNLVLILVSSTHHEHYLPSPALWPFKLSLNDPFNPQKNSWDVLPTPGISSQQQPAQYSEEVPRSYTSGALWMPFKGYSRNKTDPAASNLPAGLTDEEWQYIQRNPLNWGTIQAPSETVVFRDRAYNSVPANSYNILRQAMKSANMSEHNQRVVIEGFLQNHLVRCHSDIKTTFPDD